MRALRAAFLSAATVCLVLVFGADPRLLKVNPEDRCTTIAVGKDGTSDGSTMLSYNADCAECDWRLNKVEAKDWPVGSLRPIYLLTGQYPRQVRDDRGETWAPSNLEDMPQRPEWEKMRGPIIGYIPQVPHTYALIEGLYGHMNEFQVSIGESTCDAKLWAAPVGVDSNGKALLEASELSQIGLERGKTAREVIQIMGGLAVEYGFYSADWDTSHGVIHLQNAAAEALSVSDPDEAWIFHILPDDTGASAVWVAQRVPDNHVAAVANQFVIRDVIEGDPNFMYSENIFDVATRLGWYDPSEGKPLNFLETYAPPRFRANYCNRRRWRIFSMIDPESNLPIETDPYARDYPFSWPVPENKKVTQEAMMRIMRDHYEGTKYSTTQGLAAGPFGDPNRFDTAANGNMTAAEAGNDGEFPRTISIFRTSYSVIAQGRKSVPNLLARIWFAQYAPDFSNYTPLYVASRSIPRSWMRGTMHKYDPSSAWWNFASVGNYASRFYSFTMDPKDGLVRKLQRSLDATGAQDVDKIEAKALNILKGSTTATAASAASGQREDPGTAASTSTSRILKATTKEDTGAVSRKPKPSPSPSPTAQVIDLLTAFTTSKGDSISQAWADLFPLLITTYRDGYVMGDLDKPAYSIRKMFYPKWWLDTVGFFDIKGFEGGLLFASRGGRGGSASANSSSSSSAVISVLLMFIFSAVFGLVGFYFGRKSGAEKKDGGSSFSISVAAAAVREDMKNLWITSRRGYTKVPDYPAFSNMLEAELSRYSTNKNRPQLEGREAAAVLGPQGAALGGPLSDSGSATWDKQAYRIMMSDRLMTMNNGSSIFTARPVAVTPSSSSPSSSVRRDIDGDHRYQTIDA